MIPAELFWIILLQVDARTRMIAVPLVCTQWKEHCRTLSGVHLDFSWWTGNIPWESLGIVCSRFGGTTAVTLGYGVEVSHAHVMELPKHCPGLERIAFANCAFLENRTVVALAAACNGLTHVGLRYAALLTDFAAVGLAAACTKLTHIDFNNAGAMTDAGVIALATAARGLAHVDLGGCDNLTDVSVRALASKCPQLVHVVMDRNIQLTLSAAMMILRKRCRTLVHD